MPAPAQNVTTGSTSQSDPSALAPEPLTDLGFLFVHGIGGQQRGETLLQFGEPIHDWLHDWFDANHRRLAEKVTWDGVVDWHKRVVEVWREKGEAVESLDRFETVRGLLAHVRRFKGSVSPDAVGWTDPVAARVAFNDARIKAAEGGDPAHARLDLQWIHSDGAVHQRSWVMAESWWAEGFYAPRYRELAAWGVEGLCWTIGSHYGARVRRAMFEGARVSGPIGRVRVAGRVLLSLGYWASGLAISAAALVMLILVLGLAALPIPKLRAAVLGMQQRLAASIGDSYMLLASPLTMASIVGQLQHDYDWLSARCRSVVIVAHSQGGALAHLFLRRGVPDKLSLLLTFGSGLRKLEELRQLRKPEARTQARLATGAIFVTLVAVLVIAFGRAGGWTFAALVWGVFALLVSLYTMAEGHASRELRWWTAILKDSNVEWADYFASADPVPNGPLWDARDGGDVIPRSKVVFNTGSAWRDHTTYWRNRDEFVSKIISRITSRVDPELAAMIRRHRSRIAVASARRQWRIGWFSAARRLWIVAVGAFLVENLENWKLIVTPVGIGSLLRQAYASTRGFLSESGLGWMGAGLGRLWPSFVPTPGPVSEQVITAFRDAATPVGMLLGLYIAIHILWGCWERNEMDAFSRGSRYENFNLWSSWLGLIVGALPMVALGVFLRPLVDRSLIAMTALAAVGIISMAGAPILVYVGSRLRNTRIKRGARRP